MYNKFLKKKYDFKRNNVTNKVLFKEKSESEYRLLDEIQFNSILMKLEAKGYKITSAKLDTFLYSDEIQSFDPFIDYFENLEVWDEKTDYIKELAGTIHTTDNDYFHWAFEKWIVALVACALSEEITNQAVIIFCGRQGIGKTTWFRKLIPIALHSYIYEGAILQNDKDTKYYLAEKLLINMDELVSFGKGKNEFYKGLITLDHVEQRRPYARLSSRLTRRASFVGGSNYTEILTDLTGNRRYLCTEVLSINKEHSINIDKVYSQAIHLYKNNFKHYFDDTDVLRVEAQNRKHLHTPEEVDLIEDLFSLPDGKTPTVFMSASEVIEHIKSRRKIYKNFSVEQIGKALVLLGYKKRTKQKKYELILNAFESLSIAS